MSSSASTRPGQGLHEITSQVGSLVTQARIHEGLCTVFLRHTSASLVIQENADPAALRDLEAGWPASLQMVIQSTVTMLKDLTTCRRTCVLR